MFLNIHRSGVLTALAWLVPQESAARESQSRRVLCTPYNHATCHFMQSHIRKVYACLAVTCYLHFWQNDRDLLRTTAVTRGWNGYRNNSQHRQLALEKKILPPLLSITSPALEPLSYRSPMYPRSPIIEGFSALLTFSDLSLPPEFKPDRLSPKAEIMTRELDH